MHADTLVACGHQWDLGVLSRAGSIEMSQYSAGKEKTSECQTEGQRKEADVELRVLIA